MMNGWYHDGGGWGGWLVMTLAMVVFWSLVVVAVVMLFRRPDQTGSSVRSPHAPADPLAILDERLARGDVDLEDYHARRRALRGPP